jgi:hypothetical protein
MGLRAALPLRLRTRLRAAHRAAALRRALAGLEREPRGSEEIWERLVYGWGNEGFSSQPEYLAAVSEAAFAERGPILECGSGLTTLVLATIAKRTGSAIWTLEDDSSWLRVVDAAVQRFDLEANVRLARLRSYGEFEWYDTATLQLPSFALAVCDGPSGRTRGGRYGLLPVLGENLSTGCTILFDDAARPGEQDVIRRWESEERVRTEVRGTHKPYAVVTVL